MSFERRPDLRNPRPWVTGGLAVGAAALAIRGILTPSRLRRTAPADCDGHLIGPLKPVMRSAAKVRGRLGQCT